MPLVFMHQALAKLKHSRLQLDHIEVLREEPFGMAPGAALRVVFQLRLSKATKRLLFTIGIAENTPREMRQRVEAAKG